MVSHEHDGLKRRAARLSVVSNSILVAAKLTVGVLTGSVSILSEAAHSGVDLLASGIAWYSVRESGKPADDQHRFGHGKIENVAGTVEALLIFGAAFYIVWEAVAKLGTGNVEVGRVEIGVAVMAVSALVNFFISRHLLAVSVATDSVALEADALHLRTDVYTSVGVLAGLAAMKLTGIAVLDPIIAIVVAVMIVKAAWDLTKTAFFQILDVSLPEEDEAVIRDVLQEHGDYFLEYHKLRTRKSGHIRHIDMHLMVPKHMTVEAGHSLSHHISGRIQTLFPHSHILVHIEPCQGECDICAKGCPSKELVPQ